MGQRLAPTTSACLVLCLDWPSAHGVPSEIAIITVAPDRKSSGSGTRSSSAARIRGGGRRRRCDSRRRQCRRTPSGGAAEMVSGDRRVDELHSSPRRLRRLVRSLRTASTYSATVKRRSPHEPALPSRACSLPALVVSPNVERTARRSAPSERRRWLATPDGVMGVAQIWSEAHYG